MISSQFRCLPEGLISSVEDSVQFDDLGEKWNVKTDDLIDKIKSLTGAQIDTVYSHIDRFRNSGKSDIGSWSKEL